MSAMETTTYVRAYLAHAKRRSAWMAFAWGASAAVIVAAVLRVAGWPAPGVSSTVSDTSQLLPAAIVVVLLASAGGILAVLVGSRTRTTIARRLEQAAPNFRNVLVTAEELLDAPDRVAVPVRALVLESAARAARATDVATLFPSRRAFGACAAALTLWSLTFVPRDRLPSAVRMSAASTHRIAAIRGVRIEVRPPSYTSLPVTSERNPTRVDVVAGSRVHIDVDAIADSVSVELISETQTLVRDASGQFRGTFIAESDGFLALNARLRTDAAGARQLIGLSVSPDQAPRVRVTAPGHDVRLENANRTLALRIDADDDFGLATLRLRYTKVSGSGERFTFTDGGLPLAVTRRDERAWTASGALVLNNLDLAPGDMVVYRAVVTDRRPGAVPVESDAYIAEITALGAIAAPGFAIDNDQSRYALSQQMVILKTQRLLDRRATTPPEAFAADALELASEQRRVRAEFVFMMGGELADEVTADASMSDLNETAEAEAEGDLAAGRMANQGRIALLRAIRDMSRASTALTSTLVSEALVNEKRALVQIERAFSRSRIILRALTERESLDMSRRLSGLLTAVTRDVRATSVPANDAYAAGLRAVLADLATIVGDTSLASDAATRLTRAAQRVLQLGPSLKPRHEIATDLGMSQTALARGDVRETRRRIDDASVRLGDALRTVTVASRRRDATFESRVLDGRARTLREKPRGGGAFAK